MIVGKYGKKTWWKDEFTKEEYKIHGCNKRWKW
jgi:hypothetical protein